MEIGEKRGFSSSFDSLQRGGLPGDSELPSTWLISVFDMLRSLSWYLAYPRSALVGGSQEFVGGDEGLEGEG